MIKKMKLLITVAVIIFLSNSNILSQSNFEGKIVFQVKNKSVLNQISYLVKGDKYRIEPKAAKGMGTMLYSGKTKIMTILIAPNKMYMEIPFDLSVKKKVKKEKTTSYFKNTGETKNILGYKSEKFEFINKGKKGIAWLTKDLGRFLFFRNPKNKTLPQDDWKAAIISENYFPMVVSEIDSKGNPNTMFEVIEISKQKLPDSLFVPPADYKKFEVPKMMNRKK